MSTENLVQSNPTSVNPSINEVDNTSNSVDDVEQQCALCNPRKVVHRYFVLIFLCFLGFGSYFCYDNPGALQGQITSVMGISTAQYSMLYSLYSWPNVILCFFGGFLIDKVFGIRLGAIIFSFIILGGQIAFAMGAYLNKFWLMGVGRFIFGIGGESLSVTQNTYAVSWFKGKELNMVFGLQLSFARVGSTVNFNSMMPLYDWLTASFSGYECLGFALLIASLTCALSFICSLILAYFDKRAERILKRDAGKTGEVVRLSDVKDFPVSFWLLSVICVTYYVSIFSFVSLGTIFFQRKFGMEPYNANAIDSVVYVISAGASPVLGLLVDKTGLNLSWVFIAVVTSIGSHMLLAFTYLNPWVGMVIMGLSYSLLACALWPMVALVVPEYQLGTAYGLMQAVQNLGLAVIAMAAGKIVDEKGYLVLEVFFLSFLCLSLIAVIVLFIYNARTGGILNLTVKERQKMDEEVAAAEALQREKLLLSGSMADITPHDLLHPRSEFHIRNRYLSRLGAKLPPHYDISLAALIHRTGLNK